MNTITAFLSNEIPTVIMGAVLMIGVLVLAWFDKKRISPMPHLGMVMVKNRLNSSD